VLPETWDERLAVLENEERVESVLGLARRLPGLQINKVEWAAADIARDDLGRTSGGRMR
jgi:hypothetical protein